MRMPSTAVRAVILNSVSPQAQAFLARTTGIGGKYRAAYIKLINGLVRAGVWPKLDVLYMFATQDTTNALLNLVSASFAATANGSPTFTVDRGYNGTNGSSTVYLDTGFNPSTAGGKYTQNDAHLSLYSNTNSAAASILELGLVTSAQTTTQIGCRFTSDLAFYRVNDNSTASAGVAVTTSNGFYCGVRTSSSASFGYKDAVDQGVSAVTSAALTNGNFPLLLQRTVPATLTSGSARQLCMASFGGSLTPAEVSSFNTHLRAYLGSMGVL